MNLVQLATELEYVPKDQLAQMSQDPNNRFPQYLVLSEIQRRTANEKAYAAAQPQPTTTIAEEVVGEFMQPQGLQAGMPSVSAPTDSFSTEPMGIPASAPMQQPITGMAEGGLTEYMEEVSSELQRIKEKESRYAARNKKQEEGETIFSTSLSPKNYVIPDERYKKYNANPSQRAFDAYRPIGLLLNAASGEGAFSGMDRVIPESEVKGLESAMRQSRNEMQQRQQGLASGGLTAYANGGSLEQSFADPYTNVLGSSTNPYPTDATSIDATQKSFLADRYTKKDGSIDYGTAIFDGIDAVALAAILAPEPVSTAAGTAAKFASTAGRGLMNLIRSPKQTFNKVSQKVGQRKIDAGKVPDVGPNAINPNLTVPFAQQKIAQQVGKDVIKKKGLQTAGATYVGSKFLPEEENQSDPFFTQKPDGSFVSTRPIKKIDDKDDSKKNIATGIAKPKKEIDYDLVGLGGLIMGARNMSELGMGLAGLAEKKQARADALLEGQAQQDYYKASAEKIRAEIEGLPLEKTRELLTSVLKVLENEDGSLTEEKILEYGIYRDNLQLKLLKAEGIDLSNTGINVNQVLDAAAV